MHVSDISLSNLRDTYSEKEWCVVYPVYCYVFSEKQGQEQRQTDRQRHVEKDKRQKTKTEDIIK